MIKYIRTPINLIIKADNMHFYKHTHVDNHTHTYTYTHIYAYMHIHTHAHTYIYTYINMITSIIVWYNITMILYCLGMCSWPWRNGCEYQSSCSQCPCWYYRNVWWPTKTTTQYPWLWKVMSAYAKHCTLTWTDNWGACVGGHYPALIISHDDSSL